MSRTPFSRRHPAGLASLSAILVLAVALSGCLDGLSDEDEEMEPIAFSDSRGPGGTDPLIPLTEDPIEDAQAILDECDNLTKRQDCIVEHLEATLGAAGSEYAFDVLDAMIGLDREVERASHPIAHLLGHEALYVYGTIGNALANCSHKVFQGCIHGALQEYFRHVPELDSRTIQGACPEDASSFERYACYHGLGHGLVLATEYHLGDALDLCALLDRQHSRDSCYGGAFMENVVAYLNEKRQGDDGHDHEHGGGKYWVNKADLHFPCNTVKTDYEYVCWGMQTSLILHLNGGDFQETAQVCDELEGELREKCYRSMGRDVSSYTARDPAKGSDRCAYASDDEMRAACVGGFISTVVTRYADPALALPLCPKFDEQDKSACYENLARTGRSMTTDEELAQVCEQAEEEYRDDCRRGGRL